MSSKGEEMTEEETGRIGIFPNWDWVYATVVVYGVVVIGVLTILSRILGFGVGR